MKNIQLTLSIEETNLLLEGLSNMPYKRVAELVNKIQLTGQTQLEQTNGVATNNSQKSKTNAKSTKPAKVESA